MRALPAELQVRIVERFNALTDDPRPPWASELMADLNGVWKLRVGHYRVACETDGQARVVYVRAIGHRRTFYQELRRRR